MPRDEDRLRRRLVRKLFDCLRMGDLPTIIVSPIPPLIHWPPFHYFGWYRRETDTMRIWSGRGYEDTAWHEAVHATEARLGLEHCEERATELAAHLNERYHLPSLELTHRCDWCSEPIYFGLELCWSCGGAMEWGRRRIPIRRNH